MSIRVDQVIDVKGLVCPRPLLKTKQALRGMQSGEVLEVIADDRTTRVTIPDFLKQTGDELLGIEERGLAVHHFVRKR